jgi:hypothetical protein
MTREHNRATRNNLRNHWAAGLASVAAAFVPGFDLIASESSEGASDTIPSCRPDASVRLGAVSTIDGSPVTAPQQRS